MFSRIQENAPLFLSPIIKIAFYTTKTREINISYLFLNIMFLFTVGIDEADEETSLFLTISTYESKILNT